MLKEITIVVAFAACVKAREISGKLTIQEYTNLYTHTIYPHLQESRGAKYDFKTHLWIFLTNIERLYKLNLKNKTFKFGYNQFTDLTFQDFEAGFTGFRRRLVDYKDFFNYRFRKNVVLPEILTGHVGVPDPTSVKVQPMSQRNCASSYAYSAIAAVESYLVMHYLNVSGHSLSRQEGLDCEPKGQCSIGGVPHEVLEGVKNSGGINLDADYPRTGYGQKNILCYVNLPSVFAKVIKYHLFLVKNETELAQALYLHGPLITTIYASPSVRDYQSGILIPTDCNSTAATHAILLVGYGTTLNGIDYWVLMNSWGEEWGYNGYLYLVKGKGACRIGRDYNAAVIAEPTDKNIKKRPPILDVLQPMLKRIGGAQKSEYADDEAPNYDDDTLDEKHKGEDQNYQDAEENKKYEVEVEEHDENYYDDDENNSSKLREGRLNSAAATIRFSFK